MLDTYICISVIYIYIRYIYIYIYIYYTYIYPPGAPREPPSPGPWRRPASPGPSIYTYFLVSFFGGVGCDSGSLYLQFPDPVARCLLRRWTGDPPETLNGLTCNPLYTYMYKHIILHFLNLSK